MAICSAAFFALREVLPSYMVDVCSNPMKHPNSQHRFDSHARRAESVAGSADAKLDTRKLVNLVVAKDFNLAPEGIQIQGLEVRISLSCLSLR